ncbi:MAG: recombinase family protein, partial [Acidobacteriaceae bacterium]
DGKKTGGGFYSRGPLYKLLRNHLYVGEIEHKGSIYLGEHEAILDRELWGQVQELLDENRQGARRHPRTSSGSMLTGLLFGESGVRYIPTSAHKRGRRYHYYTSQARIKGDKKDESIGRLPGPALEAAVAERILRLLQSPTEILDAVKPLETSDVNYDKILKNAQQRASDWPRMSPGEKAALIQTLLHHVVVHESSIELRLNLDSIVRLLQDMPIPEVSSQDGQTLCLDIPFHHIPQGKALKLVLENGRNESPASTEAIAKAIARARSWYELIVAGKATGLPDLARQHGLTHHYVKSIFPLAFLSPQSVELLLTCRDGQPRTLESLKGRVPIRWDAQKTYLADMERGTNSRLTTRNPERGPLLAPQ